MGRAEKAHSAAKIDQKQPARLNFWIAITVVAGSALLLTAVFGGHGLMRWLQSVQEKKTLSAELEKIEERNAHTRREIDSLRHNGKYIETIARRDLGMVKADEIIYQFPTSENKSQPIKALPEGQ